MWSINRRKEDAPSAAAATRGYVGPGVSQGFKAGEDVYLSFKDVKDVIQQPTQPRVDSCVLLLLLVYLIPLTTNHS